MILKLYYIIYIMINQSIETTLCHIDIEASKIYVPHDH